MPRPRMWSGPATGRPPAGANERRLRQFTTLLEHSTDAVVIVDEQARLSEWNSAAERLFGWTRPEMLNAPLRGSIPQEELAQFERVWTRLTAGEVVAPYGAVRMRRDGSRSCLRVQVTAVQEKGAFAGVVASYRDVPLESGSADRMPGAELDWLTGLPGRRELQHRLAEPVPAGLIRAVAVLDVDAFALVNQTYGPDTGDEVLRELGHRLGAIGADVSVGRWQADEFVCLLDAAAPVADIDAYVAAAIRAARVPFEIGPDLLHLTLSAGLASSHGVQDTDLLRMATDALRVAKQAGRDRGVWFTDEHGPTASGGMRLANELHDGIARDELRLHFQPILDLSSNHLVGVEALVRWERPGLGLLGPAAFIDVAERTGQIVPLGAWVARQACEVAVDLAALASGPHTVSINLSARQLSDPGLVDMLCRAFADTGCQPTDMIVEVTETALTHDLSGATATLKAIKALGVSIALDDFGTGYSSLLYLRHFPVDAIKIDQSFVAGLGVEADDTAIVASTISLAHSVGVQAVAEGVETAGQLALLRDMGCDFAQGYLFSRPLPIDQLHRWLAAHAADQPGSRGSDRRQLVPEAPRILRLHREGASLNTIAAALNVDGARTARGSRWTAPSVAKVIARAQYPSLPLA